MIMFPIPCSVIPHPASGCFYFAWIHPLYLVTVSPLNYCISLLDTYSLSLFYFGLVVFHHCSVHQPPFPSRHTKSSVGYRFPVSAGLLYCIRIPPTTPRPLLLLIPARGVMKPLLALYRTFVWNTSRNTHIIILILLHSAFA